MLRGFWNRLLGNRGERAAVRHLKSLGYRIIGRNVRNRAGEIDIIALDGAVLVFVEVKTRKSSAAGAPEEAVDRRKQRQLVRAASMYLVQRGLQNHRFRFDVVSILWPEEAKTPEIRHYQHAFNATDAGMDDA